MEGTSKSVATVIPAVNQLLKKLNSSCDDEREVVTEVRHKLYNAVQTRFGDIQNQEVNILATVLDPRYKLMGFTERSAGNFL